MDQQKGMTPEEKLDALFEFVCEYKAAHDGKSPSLREIEASGDAPYNSTSHISSALRKLEERGLIRLGPKGATRSIEVVGARWLLPEEMVNLEQYVKRTATLAVLNEVMPE